MDACITIVCAVLAIGCIVVLCMEDDSCPHCGHPHINPRGYCPACGARK